ncbi:MAG: 2,3-diaminopropionate biosynthesis protein SbnA [Blastocatellia bacterium AA13]|nr:MAG: 2,3-diaminopropionate biosynthesis protein SbnA [Blastocatellia bacterium AA13]
MTYEGVLSSIGNTPLVRLNRVLGDERFQLYAKLEMLNPGGSMKDRPAFNIIRNGIESGSIQPDTVVVESSSGNMGVGLAQACACFGLRFVCVVDPKTTMQNIRLIEAYGADIVKVTEPDPVTGEYLQARINVVKTLLRSIEHAFWPNQYATEYNPLAHHDTMREIVKELGKVDYVFCATSTCGTMRGCAEYIRENQLDTKVYAVDAVGSVIFGGPKAKRLIPGHGAAVRPQLFQPDLAYDVIHVTDLDCVIGCRRLVRKEAILAGGSSGGVLMAVEYAKPEIPEGAVCVMILADRGERYLDTVYSNEWVREHFGEVSYMWHGLLEAESCTALIN